MGLLRSYPREVAQSTHLKNLNVYAAAVAVYGGRYILVESRIGRQVMVVVVQEGY